MKLELFDDAIMRLPDGISLPEKDRPIMLAAIEAQATHLLTGDLRHFGSYFEKRIAGILIMPPGDYLARGSAPDTPRSQKSGVRRGKVRR